jgi:hypothetical protein
VPARDPSDRALVARIAAAERWARTDDRAAATAAARQALADRWERQADPDGQLDPAERARHAAHLRRAPDRSHRDAINRRRRELLRQPAPCIRCRVDHTGGTMFCADCRGKCAWCENPRAGYSAYCPACSAVANDRGRRRPALPEGSPRCWCSVCGRLFRSIDGFDAHQSDRHGCGDPAAAGLVEVDGLWATPRKVTRRPNGPVRSSRTIVPGPPR